MSLINMAEQGFRNLVRDDSTVQSTIGLAPDEFKKWTLYVKFSVSGEIGNLTAQYLVKICLLIVYHRLTYVFRKISKTEILA